MGTYKKGDSVKIEVVNEATKESEWMWLLVESSDDKQRMCSERSTVNPSSGSVLI